MAEKPLGKYEAQLLLLLKQIDPRVPWEANEAVFEDRRFRPDLFVRNAKFAVEVDGGCHRILEKALRDYEKRQYMLAQGWMVVPVANEQIKRAGLQMAVFILKALCRWQALHELCSHSDFEAEDDSILSPRFPAPDKPAHHRER